MGGSFSSFGYVSLIVLNNSSHDILYRRGRGISDRDRVSIRAFLATGGRLHFHWISLTSFTNVFAWRLLSFPVFGACARLGRGREGSSNWKDMACKERLFGGCRSWEEWTTLVGCLACCLRQRPPQVVGGSRQLTLRSAHQGDAQFS